MTFEKKLGLSNINHERMHKLIMDLIPNDWNHIATPKTPFKNFLS